MKHLAPAVTARLTEGFLVGLEDVDVDGLVSDEGRALDLESVDELLVAARDRFDDQPTQADGWLAPRLHTLLRLSRREAAAKGLWLHLAIVDQPAYVRWRHGGEVGRYKGNDVNQVFSRLWWAAELFRVGSDYSQVAGAFSPPDIANTIMRLRAAHNRPLCTAFLDFTATRRTDGKRLIGRQINPMSTAINSQLFVATLDAIAPDAGTNLDAALRWRADSVTAGDLIDAEPIGPEDQLDYDFEEKVAAVRALLDHIADGAGIATAGDPEAGSRRPGDAPESDGAED